MGVRGPVPSASAALGSLHGWGFMFLHLRGATVHWPVDRLMASGDSMYYSSCPKAALCGSIS